MAQKSKKASAAVLPVGQGLGGQETGQLIGRGAQGDLAQGAEDGFEAQARPDVDAGQRAGGIEEIA